MKFKKLKKQLFGREVTGFELLSTFIGFTAGLIAVLSQIGFLSISSIGASERILNPVITILGSLSLLLIALFLYKKRKDWVLSIVILILGILIFVAGSNGFLTSVYNPSGQLGNIPTTIEECKSIGIIIPIENNCPTRYLEVGNAGENFICCLEDNCETVWKRKYNQETKIFEFICEG